MNAASEDTPFATFAAALAAAHVAPFPAVEAAGALPATMADAMQVQAAVAETLGAEVAGWKVGFSADGVPFAAPLFSGYMETTGATLPMRQGGVWGVEPEIAVRLGRDLPPRPGQPYSRAEIMDAVAAVLTGIEIVGSRIIDHDSAPFPVRIADNFMNAGYVAGAELADWRHLDLTALRATLTLGGKTVHDAAGGHPNGDPLKPLEDYANAQCDRLGGLKAGQIVTTGSLCGLVKVPEACEAVAVIDGIGEARLTLSA
jgi:2-keto-4-pentenoate hydratase